MKKRSELDFFSRILLAGGLGTICYLVVVFMLGKGIFDEISDYFWTYPITLIFTEMFFNILYSEYIEMVKETRKKHKI